VHCHDDEVLISRRSINRKWDARSDCSCGLFGSNGGGGSEPDLWCIAAPWTFLSFGDFCRMTDELKNGGGGSRVPDSMRGLKFFNEDEMGGACGTSGVEEERV
jgi:hypothetical protein